MRSRSSANFGESGWFVATLVARLVPRHNNRPAKRAQARRSQPGYSSDWRPVHGPRGLQLGLILILQSLPALVLGIGFLVEGLQPPLQRSDAIVVISGDEDLARFRAGLNLWQQN